MQTKLLWMEKKQAWDDIRQILRRILVLLNPSMWPIHSNGDLKLSYTKRALTMEHPTVSCF